VKELTHLVDRLLQQMRMLRSPQADSFPPRVVQAEMVGMSSLTIKADSSMCGTTMAEGRIQVWTATSVAVFVAMALGRTYWHLVLLLFTQTNNQRVCTTRLKRKFGFPLSTHPVV
jgi:hypothetical protein